MKANLYDNNIVLVNNIVGGVVMCLKWFSENANQEERFRTSLLLRRNRSNQGLVFLPSVNFDLNRCFDMSCQKPAITFNNNLLIFKNHV